MKHTEKHSVSTARRWWRPCLVAGTVVVLWLTLSAVVAPSAGHHHLDIDTLYSDIVRHDASGPLHTFEDPLYTHIGEPTLEPAQKHRHIGTDAMVASDVPRCSGLGKQILLRGGNAADAAVTVALCIGSINFHSSGIGGGAFILSKHAHDIISIDAREMAPALAFKDMYAKNAVLAQVGGLAIAIPGELKGLDTLFHRHGSGNLTWKQLLEPVIELNRNGFECTQVLASALQKIDATVFSKVPQIKQNWQFAYRDNGDVISEGDWVTRPQLADTLELIANNGSSAVFYDPAGPIATKLAQTAQQFHGVVTADDFGAYRVNVEEPISVNLTVSDKTYQVFTTRGVSSGLALTAGLKFFDRVYHADDDDVLQTHKLIESFKWLASTRTNLGDFQGNVSFKQQLVDKFTSDEWVESILANGEYLDSQTFDWHNYKPKFELTEPKGTSHFSIVDKDSNSISMTTTVNLLFGSTILDPSTGIILNNEMDDFSQPNVSNAFGLKPSIYNFIDAYKRPMSSTAATFVVDTATQQTDFLIGAAGGSRIPTAILQALYRTYYQKKDLLDTIAFPRLHHQLIPEFVMVENVTVFNEEHRLPGDRASLTELLAAKGHNFTETGALTAMNGIKRQDTHLEGVSDYWRKRGEADGY